jgi:transcriptional regulator with XRE-family HTH domain
MQSDIAQIIGVTEASIWNWENGTQPHVKYIPNIIKFLGYIPFKSAETSDAMDRLKYVKRINGLTIKQLAKEIGCHYEQLMDWMGGKVRPGRKNLDMIEKFIEAL